MEARKGKRGRTDRITRFPSWGDLMRELRAYLSYLFILPTALRWGVAVFHTGDKEGSNTLGTTEREREKWGGGRVQGHKTPAEISCRNSLKHAGTDE